jgi:hypothetical protein
VNISETDWFLMQAFYNAEQDGRDLSEAGSEAMMGEGLTLEQYGRALKRLEDDGLMVVDVLQGGMGQVLSAVPIRITRQGVLNVEAKRASGQT